MSRHGATGNPQPMLDGSLARSSPFEWPHEPRIIARLNYVIRPRSRLLTPSLRQRAVNPSSDHRRNNFGLNPFAVHLALVRRLHEAFPKHGPNVLNLKALIVAALKAG